MYDVKQIVIEVSLAVYCRFGAVVFWNASESQVRVHCLLLNSRLYIKCVHICIICTVTDINIKQTLPYVAVVVQALNFLDKIRHYVDDVYDDEMTCKEMEDLNYFMAEYDQVLQIDVTKLFSCNSIVFLCGLVCVRFLSSEENVETDMTSPGNVRLKPYTSPCDVGAVIDKFTISKPIALSGGYVASLSRL